MPDDWLKSISLPEKSKVTRMGAVCGSFGIITNKMVSCDIKEIFHTRVDKFIISLDESATTFFVAVTEVLEQP